MNNFKPDWKLGPSDALATHMKIALTRHSVTWGTALHTDEQWHEMCQDIIDAMNDDITADVVIVRTEDVE